MNKLTPGSNLKWESKFMLHEHSDQLVIKRKESQKRERPTLDEQQLEEFEKD